ncbi:sugar ABC transporter substrate-binding protein [Streptomyces sp. RB6PN25]|uniref:Sugar ABC transporter substrate-binding protein n=1 Tax=Streptomyces humicola TaxID=2953240 RepID=A0ABT1PT95_9ACTN|nr:sugar ABC transporter substrate-binding protein [Streptomyces humicola]MCQ4080896.1 sugar ABC transporter substrate-binding protein [Streptomyces humicola]
MKRVYSSAIAVGLSLTALAGCGSSGSTSSATNAHGPIKIWYSNNPQEIAWGEQMVAAWNKAHPTEKVSAEQVPTGKSSEEVIGAAITAGTEPCLIFNTSPASVPQFQQQGGLVPLNKFPGAVSYIQSRSGATAEQYKSSDGNYYQLPWKSNPVMIFYNKKIFQKAGINPDNPPLNTYAQFLATAKKVVASGAAKYAIYPAPTSEFYQPWFDFYPLFAAESGGKELMENGKSQFNSPAGQQATDFWRTLYANNLAGKDAYNGDSFADGTAAMAIVGPWAISTYDNKVDWGEVPVPTSQGIPAAQTHTYSDAKNVAMYSSCKNQGTAWDVLKFATSQEQDGQLLNMTGQMPMRTNLQQTYANYFAKNPAYNDFASAASRTIGVPQLSESISIWQDFRNGWEKSVISGQNSTQQFLSQTAAQADKLAAQPQ